MKRFISIAIFIAVLLTFASCTLNLKENNIVDIAQEPAAQTLNQSFEILPIDEEIEKRVSGVSWKQESPVSLDNLSYVRVIYWGFDDKQHEGELIVHESVAQEVAEIFVDLYENRFPIEKIRLIDEYAADDSKSMEDNNTSGFCCREVASKPGKISKHSYGLAIDINPVQNPYIYKDEIVPTSGRLYTDRADVKKGMIQKEDACYTAFTSRGWQWGGAWKYEKDYQHFQKNIEIEE